MTGQPPRPPPSATIAAILTPLAQGGIAILEVVGPRAFELIRQVFQPRTPAPLEPDARRLLYGHIVDAGEVVDEVLVRLVPASEERRVEVNCHGGVVAVQRVLECFVARGAVAAEAEALAERRARSRIEAEATLAVVRAPTPLGVETLLDQLNGALERALRSLPWDNPEAMAAALRGLLATERLGCALWQPPAVAITGPANSGKSTLFNALAREERMIVSPRPGTTRDAVSAEVAIDGLPVWLTDTAGEREPGSAIEAEAIARGRSAAAGAGLVLLLLDGSAPHPSPIPPAGAVPRLVVLNKADLGLAPWARSVADPIVISAVTGQGLDELRHRIVSALVSEATYSQGRPVVFTDRQALLLDRALGATQAGLVDDARRLVEELF